MWRHLLRWIAPFLVAATCWLPSAYAQRYAVPGSEPETAPTAALPYTVAFASTLLLLVLVCAPSRKQ
jgi:hypothetical protein